MCGIFMRIFYHTIQIAPLDQIPDNEKADYQSDLLFHGFRQLFGEACIDFPRKDYLYKDYQGDTSRLWGKGFSYSRVLDDIIVNDRERYQHLALTNWFDLLVLSIHHSCHRNHNIIKHSLEWIRQNAISTPV